MNRLGRWLRTNDLRWLWHASFCNAERRWIPVGDDAICSQCGFIVQGGGREARNSERLRRGLR